LPICDRPRGGVWARRASLNTRWGATVNDDDPTKGDETEPEILGLACPRGDSSLELDGDGAVLTSWIRLDMATAGCDCITAGGGAEAVVLLEVEAVEVDVAGVTVSPLHTA
jgi:hypothetical protein